MLDFRRSGHNLYTCNTLKVQLFVRLFFAIFATEGKNTKLSAQFSILGQVNEQKRKSHNNKNRKYLST